MFNFLANMSWIYLLAVIPVLGVLVFVHELGHFLAARRVGVHDALEGIAHPARADSLGKRVYRDEAAGVYQLLVQRLPLWRLIHQLAEVALHAAAEDDLAAGP